MEHGSLQQARAAVYTSVVAILTSHDGPAMRGLARARVGIDLGNRNPKQGSVRKLMARMRSAFVY